MNVEPISQLLHQEQRPLFAPVDAAKSRGVPPFLRPLIGSSKTARVGDPGSPANSNVSGRCLYSGKSAVDFADFARYLLGLNGNETVLDLLSRSSSREGVKAG